MSHKTTFIVNNATIAVLLCPLVTTVAVSTNRPANWFASNVSAQQYVSSYAPHAIFATDPKLRDWIRFRGLVQSWREQRGSLSSVDAMISLPDYQSIIGMGERAIPLLIAQLRLDGDDPDLWFWALSAITGANPVSAHEQGNFRCMAQSWIRWSEEEYAW